jgi:hypothetical protein
LNEIALKAPTAASRDRLTEEILSMRDELRRALAALTETANAVRNVLYEDEA